MMAYDEKEFYFIKYDAAQAQQMLSDGLSPEDVHNKLKIPLSILKKMKSGELDEFFNEWAKEKWFAVRFVHEDANQQPHDVTA